MTFENDAMPGAQFFVNEQEDGACTEAIANRYKDGFHGFRKFFGCFVG